MKTKTWVIIFLILLGIVIYLFNENRKLHIAIANAKKDTLLVHDTIKVKPPEVIIDSLPAVIGLRKALANNAKEMDRLKLVYEELQLMYLEALKDTGQMISIPAAVLDTSLIRNYYQDGSLITTLDKLHTEYYFPPINSFLNTRISLGDIPVKIEKQIITNTITKPRSMLWDIGIFVAGFGMNELWRKIK